MVILDQKGNIIGLCTKNGLGHGTQVRGLAWRYGFVATHTVSMTRVIVGAADHVLHTFDVQLRSLEDGKTMFDIELGNIEHDISLERA